MAVLLGRTSAGTSGDFEPSASTIAWKFTAVATGQLATIFAQTKVSNPSFSTAKLGIYDDDAANARPGNLLASATVVATGTGIFSTAVSQAIVNGTVYWLAFSATGEQIDFQGDAAGAYKAVTTAFPSPFGVPTSGTTNMVIWGEDAGTVSSPPPAARPMLFALQKFRPLWTPTTFAFPVPLSTPAAALGAFSLDADVGVYALTGVAAAVVADRLVNADPAAYALTGTAAAPVAGRIIDAAPGSYAVTGVATLPVATRLINALPGAYTVTGTAALPVADRIVTTAPGVYAVTGVAAGLPADRIIGAAPGSYTLTGTAAALVYTPAAGAYVLNAAPGAFVITGSAAQTVATLIPEPTVTYYTSPFIDRRSRRFVYDISTRRSGGSS